MKHDIFNFKKISIIISVILMLLFITIIIMLFLLSNNQEVKPEDNNSDGSIVYKYYSCKQDEYKSKDYTINYLYKFVFENNKLINGKTIYIYNFNNLDSYNSFIWDESIINSLDNIEENNNEMTKTLTLSQMINQEETGKSALEKYIKKVESYGYNCEIEINN